MINDLMTLLTVIKGKMGVTKCLSVSENMESDNVAVNVINGVEAWKGPTNCGN